MAKISKRRGRWVIDFYDHHGKRRWITMPKGSAKKKATKKLREIEDQVSRGVFIPDKRIPVFKQVAKDWLDYKRANIRHNSWQRYDGYVRNHYQAFLNLPVNRITTAKIEKFISDKQEQNTNITTLKKMLVALNQIFNYAVRHHYIDHNPVASAERPKDQRSTEEKEAIQVLTPDQITALLSKVENHKFRVLFQLAIFSGARESELVALKWNCVDWQNSQIEIKRSYNGGRWYPPKTKTSRRKIDIGPETLSELKRWRLASYYSAESDLVFANNAGNPLDPNELTRRHFYPALEAAECPKIRFHDLRHTYASLKIEQGENIVYISKQMGHSKVSTTLDIYAHLMKSENQESACGLEKMVFEKNGSKLVAKTDFSEKK
jgi:integrase